VQCENTKTLDRMKKTASSVQLDEVDHLTDAHLEGLVGR
jgi:hypothetical protein